MSEEETEIIGVEKTTEDNDNKRKAEDTSDEAFIGKKQRVEDMEMEAEMAMHPIQFTIRIFNSSNLIYSTANKLKTNYKSISSFMETVGVKLQLNSKRASIASTIPRPSDASAVSRPSVNRKGPKPPASPRPRRDVSPLLTSTRIAECSNGSMDSSLLSNSSGSLITQIKREPRDWSRTQQTWTNEEISSLVNGYAEEGFVRSEMLWTSVHTGEPCFARWRDKSYYSGTIIKKGMNDTWNIHFDDDMEDVASETHILPIKIIGVGTRGVYCPSDVFQPEDCIVLGQNFSSSSVIYCIQTPTQRVYCPRSNMIIKENDAKELRKICQSTVFKTADINLDNIVSDGEKKTRRTKSVELKPSEKIRCIVRGLDTSMGSPSPLPMLDAPTPPPSDDSSLTPSMPARRRAKLNSANSASSDASDTGKLFHGMQFFLTASGGGDPSSSGHDISAVTYDKDSYRTEIEAKGGTVINYVGRESKNKSTYLISDNYARTVKYIYCVASGIPCVSSEWVGECLEKNTILPWTPYQLNSGWSLESSTVIPAHRRKPLKSLAVYVTAEESDELYDYWKPVLIAAEAKLLSRGRRKPAPLIPQGTEVLVTDATCAQEILSLAQNMGIPIVKPEWLVQSIITGERAEFTGHAKYMVGGGGSDTEEEG